MIRESIGRIETLGRAARRGVSMLCMLALAGVGSIAGAQMPGMPEMPGHKGMMTWSPTLFILFDQLEYGPNALGRPANVEALAWYGGAYNRAWLRAQSELATTVFEGEVEVQALYGRLVDPFWDAVVGLRVDRRWGRPDDPHNRVLFAVGLIGLAPYRFELEPTLFVSERGEVSARLEAAYQILITQRLVAEPELELNAALQAVPQYDLTPGLNDYEIGIRVRYEFRRELAPYVGWSLSRRVGGSVAHVTGETDPRSESRFVAGLRIWR